MFLFTDGGVTYTSLHDKSYPTGRKSFVRKVEFQGFWTKKKKAKNPNSVNEKGKSGQRACWCGQILHVLLKLDLLGDCGRHGDIELRFPLHLYTKNKPCLSHSASSWWFRRSQDDNSYWSELSESSLIITARSTWPADLARRSSTGCQIPFELTSCIKIHAS